MLGPKSKRAKSDPSITAEMAEKWKVPEKRGRGRPPSTGAYQGLAEAKRAANDEKERENRLALESRLLNMEETVNILKRSKMDPEDVTEQQKLAPTGDVASEMRKAAAEVVRVAKVSSNLQGPLQRALKVSASTIMGLTDVLRTRADGTAEATGSEELRQLRQQLAELSKEQEKMNTTIQTLREEIRRAREEAETAKQKAKVARQELLNSTRKNEELRQRLKEERERAEAAARKDKKIPPLSREEPMEVDQTPPTQREEEIPPPRRMLPTQQELEEFPALRPPLKGKRAVVSSREQDRLYRLLPPPECEQYWWDNGGEKVSRGRMRGTKGPAWDQMEAVSSVLEDPEEAVSSVLANPKEFQRETAREVVVLLDEVARRHMGGESILQPATSQRTRNQSATRKAGMPNHPPMAGAASGRRVPTDARKARKREKRRLKRQEEARRRADSQQGPASGPNKARPRSTTGEGPASRTRSRTRSGAETMAGATANAPWTQPLKPPPGRQREEIPIRDVPIPPDDWTPVIGRRERKGERPRSGGRITYAGAAAKAPLPSARGEPPRTDRQKRRERGGGKGAQQPTRPQIKKPPKTAAVQVTCPPGTYAETMRIARERVDLRGLGIGELRPRRARTGALLLEIPGGDGATRADTLTRELREALRDREGVIITRPIKTAELRVKDLEDSVSADDVANAIAERGQCQMEDVRVGTIRAGPNRLGTAWCRCPLTAANKIAKEGRLVVGWTRVRVEILPDRPTTCFRCLRKGHVRANCPESGDNEGLCYRCGEPGHVAGTCTAPPKCPLCKGSGRPENHRVGSEACRAPKRGYNKKANPRAEAGTARTTTPGLTRRTGPEGERARRDEGTEPMEPMDVDPPRLTPSPPPRPLEWPSMGERWSQERPLPSRHEMPIIGGGPPSPLPVPLPPSRPEPITEGEGALNRRQRLVPVLDRCGEGSSGVPRLELREAYSEGELDEVDDEEPREEAFHEACGSVEPAREEATNEEEEERGPPADAEAGAPNTTDGALVAPDEDGCSHNN